MTESVGRRRLPGLALAGMTAAVSGVSVFVNAYGVRAVPDAAVYTTAKNLVAAALLAAGAVGLSLVRPPPAARRGPDTGRLGVGAVAGLAYVGVVGGGVAFVLFFDGLARMAATPAAFLHDTLVVWVALLAGPLLGERRSGWNLAALALLVGGEVAVLGGVGPLGAGAGGAMVLGATVLWAVEVVVAKRLLRRVGPATVAVVRMGVGVVVLVGYLSVTGHLAALFGLDAREVGWVVVTGVLLAAYVATWFGALARARALDVTSVLVASALVTAGLQAAAGTLPVPVAGLGLALVAAGTALAVAAWPRRVPA